MTLAALRQKRAAKLEALQAIQTRAANESRDFNDNEATDWSAGETEVRALDTQIQRAEFLAESERRADADPVSSFRPTDLANYSIARAIRGAANGKLDGLEGEMHAELSRDRETRGVMVPSAVLLGEARSQTVGTPANGGRTVATQLASLTDRLDRPMLKVEAMGATVMRGLTGFLDLPSLSASGTAHWVAEDGATTRSTAAFEKVSMAPKTVSGEYQLSRRLILQSNEAIEQLLRRDLGFLLAQALDAAAARGGGTNEPKGVLSTAGVQEVTASAGLMDTTADLMAALEMDDINGTAAFLTHPAIMAAARKLKDGQGHPMPLAELFHGQRVESTTQVGSDGETPAKHPLIYGLWSELVVGYWSGVDILANPYHADVASKGGMLLHAFLDADVAVRHTSAFRYAEI